MYLLRDQGLAEEIALNVFLAAWDHAAGYDPARGKVSTWLLMMARRRSIDALRRATARGENRRADWADAQQQTGEDNLEGAVEARLEQERIRKALEALPQDQAEALALAFFQGYTHQEIAAALGQPLGTIKTRIRLAMIKLRSSLADQPAESHRREI
jgi:RNA polymerase sigma-70 factor (ECF subfamily)